MKKNFITRRFSDLNSLFYVIENHLWTNLLNNKVWVMFRTKRLSIYYKMVRKQHWEIIAVSNSRFVFFLEIQVNEENVWGIIGVILFFMAIFGIITGILVLMYFQSKRKAKLTTISTSFNLKTKHSNSVSLNNGA